MLPRTLRASGQLCEHLTSPHELLGLPAEQIADRSGISRTTLRRLETGRTGFPFETVLEWLVHGPA